MILRPQSYEERAAVYFAYRLGARVEFYSTARDSWCEWAAGNTLDFAEALPNFLWRVKPEPSYPLQPPQP